MYQTQTVEGAKQRIAHLRAHIRQFSQVIDEMKNYVDITGEWPEGVSRVLHNATMMVLDEDEEYTQR